MILRAMSYPSALLLLRDNLYLLSSTLLAIPCYHDAYAYRYAYLPHRPCFEPLLADGIAVYAGVGPIQSFGQREISINEDPRARDLGRPAYRLAREDFDCEQTDTPAESERSSASAHAIEAESRRRFQWG